MSAHNYNNLIFDKEAGKYILEKNNISTNGSWKVVCPCSEEWDLIHIYHPAQKLDSSGKRPQFKT